MTGGRETRVVKDDRQRTVAVMETADGLLNGKCEWYDSKHRLIAFGFFVNGTPRAGTFINWALFFSPEKGLKPYDVGFYCNDWVTIFEASFDSERPQYGRILEAYSDGSKIELAAG